MGNLIIVWPENLDNATWYETMLINADTGDMLVSVLDMEISTDEDYRFVATLTMVCNTEGRYNRAGEPIIAQPDGSLRTEKIQWNVLGMRTRGETI